MSRIGLPFGDHFNILLVILDGQCPLLDGQSASRNLIGAQQPIEFRPTAFPSGCAQQDKQGLVLGANTILSTWNVLLTIDDGNFILSYQAGSRRLRRPDQGAPTTRLNSTFQPPQPQPCQVRNRFGQCDRVIQRLRPLKPHAKPSRILAKQMIHIKQNLHVVA